MSNIDTDIDNLLQITDEEHLNNSNFTKEVTEPEIFSPQLTKHSLATSPWSRLFIIAVPFGAGFLGLFFVLNGIFNPAPAEFKVAETPQKPSEVVDKVEQKDGDVYAKLALSEQAEDLSKINSTENKQPPTPVKNQAEKVKPASRPSLPRTTSTPKSVQSTPRSISRMSPPPTPRNFFIASSATPSKTVKAVDPTAEFERLRNIGSFGKIAYADIPINEPTSIDSQFNEPSPAFIQTEAIEQRDNADINGEPTAIPQESPTDSIEKIRPR